MEHRELREEVTEIARRMSESGLVRMTSGNVSALTEGGDVLITPSGLDYKELEPRDIVLVDLDGEVLEGDLKPSSETPMHTGLYRERPETGGVVHTHSTYATTLACLGREVPAVHYLLAALSGEGRIPVAPYATYGSLELARAAGETLEERHSACLLQNHGALAVGASVAEAYSHAEILEEVSELYYKTLAVGEPIILPPEEISRVRARILTYGQYRATGR